MSVVAVAPRLGAKTSQWRVQLPLNANSIGAETYPIGPLVT